ncbi:MAG: NAD(P)/FAD-dependent oxidoreductase [Acidobacteria bacterium]|nr:NAD(P)/FAD-dependent oxidoreductase [Acidobacteriota bacterium]
MSKETKITRTGEPNVKSVRIAIVGSGFGGLGTAIRLKQQGVEDFIVLERAGDVGGVWRDNNYPGCACDVESHLYSFSFAPNPEWSHSFSRQSEIWDYLRRCAKDYGVLPHLRFGHEVREAVWEHDEQRWRIETSKGTYASSVLVAAAGSLSDPSIPQLRGLENFKGKVFHSARWDHAFDLTGRHIAVVGTGASAIQFVPAIQPRVGKLYVFQRTAPWIVPRRDRPLEERERQMFRRFPLAQRARRAAIYGLRELFGFAFRHPWAMKYFERIALRHLERAVADPELRAKLPPDYTIGCKRILISNDYLPALTRPNVELVTDGIAKVREHSIITRDGTERQADAIIFGTGFHVTDLPFAKHIRGKNGQTLSEIWAGSPVAHAGTTVVGFPNLFLLQGPNTGLGHTSVILMLEAQIEHVLSAVRYMQLHSVAAMEPRPEAQAAYVADIDRRMRGTVWTLGGCLSWYLDATGRNSSLWPRPTWRFRRRVSQLVPGEYLLTSDAPLNKGFSDSGREKMTGEGK